MGRRPPGRSGPCTSPPRGRAAGGADAPWPAELPGGLTLSWPLPRPGQDLRMVAKQGLGKTDAVRIPSNFHQQLDLETLERLKVDVLRRLDISMSEVDAH